MSKDDLRSAIVDMAKAQDATLLFKAIAEGKRDLLLTYPRDLVCEGGLPKDENGMRRSIADESGGWVIAEHEGEIVGWTQFNRQWGGVGIVAWGWVKREVRRRGIASELIERSLSKLREMQCHKAIAYVGVDNKGVIDLCRKLGFREEGTLENHFYGSDLILFGIFMSAPLGATSSSGIPALPLELEEMHLDFTRRSFNDRIRSAYDRLLLDEVDAEPPKKLAAGKKR